MSNSTPTVPGFADRLGDRVLVTDDVGGTFEVLRLRSELTGDPSFEKCLAERAERAATVPHRGFNRVRRVARLKPPDNRLAIVSDWTRGWRLSEVLDAVEQDSLPLGTDIVVPMLRQIVSAVAALHAMGMDVWHGALGPERLVVTTSGRLVIVEHVLGSALPHLPSMPQERAWRDLRLAVPTDNGRPRFSPRTDLLQVGLIGLSLVLGRSLRRDDYPGRVAELLDGATELRASGAREPLNADLKEWIGSAIGLAGKGEKWTIHDAQRGLARIVTADSGAHGLGALLQAVDRFYADTARVVAPVEATPEPSEAAPSAPPAGPVLVTTSEPAVASGPSPATAGISAPEPVEYVRPFPHAVSVTPVEPLPAAQPTEPMSEPPPAVEPEPAVLETLAAAHAELPTADMTPVEPPEVESPSVQAAATPPEPIDWTPRPSSAFDSFRSEPPRLAYHGPNLHAVPSPGPAPDEPVEPAYEEAPIVPATDAPARSAGLEALAPASDRLAPIPDANADLFVVHESVFANFADERELEPPAAPPDVHAELAPPSPVIPEVATAASESVVEPVAEMLAAPTPSRGSRASSHRSRPMFGVTDDGADDTRKRTIVHAQGRSRGRWIAVGAAAALVCIALAGWPYLRKQASGPASQGSGQQASSTAPGGAPQPGDRAPASKAAPGPSAARGAAAPAAAPPAAANGAAPVAPAVAAPAPVVQTGALTVGSPIPLDVLEKGEKLGSTADGPLTLAAGRHSIEVASAELVYSVTHVVDVRPGATARVDVVLPQGTANINATPWAQVWIDGKAFGETPLGNVQLTIGPHQVEFRHPELGELTRTLVVTTVGTSRLSVEMKK